MFNFLLCKLKEPVFLAQLLNEVFIKLLLEFVHGKKYNQLKFHEQFSLFRQDFKNRKFLENFCKRWSTVKKSLKKKFRENP